jgi:hypothetical protein
MSGIGMTMWSFNNLLRLCGIDSVVVVVVVDYTDIGLTVMAMYAYYFV